MSLKTKNLSKDDGCSTIQFTAVALSQKPFYADVLGHYFAAFDSFLQTVCGSFPQKLISTLSTLNVPGLLCKRKEWLFAPFLKVPQHHLQIMMHNVAGVSTLWSDVWHKHFFLYHVDSRQLPAQPLQHTQQTEVISFSHTALTITLTAHKKDK